jgi:hypothetical protein
MVTQAQLNQMPKSKAVKAAKQQYADNQKQFESTLKKPKASARAKAIVKEKQNALKKRKKQKGG